MVDDDSPRRRCRVVVVSDVHLGTAGCRAGELNSYLKSVEPEQLILLGDIVDLWYFRKGAWSESQTKVVRRVLKFATRGIPVHYVTGNHDEALRRFTELCLGELHLIDKMELNLDGKRTWFIHGDAFDLIVGTPRWLAWIGGLSYEGLEWLGGWVNSLRRLFGLPRVSLANVFKRNLPAAARHIAKFEDAVIRSAAERGVDAVVCGHLHVPANREAQYAGKTVRYLNSGDWVDSCSALEYRDGAWHLVRFADLLDAGQVETPKLDDTVPVLPEPAAA
ncbi:UDP-2,3-diacylglucosamine hydrolase [Planctomycetota bacterium]|nr:UDP-2,3-diacylglucosamine hydrolase [Planctomycetota bacterium]